MAAEYRFSVNEMHNMEI